MIDLWEKAKDWLEVPPKDGVIGKSRIRRKDGYDKASGKGKFTSDISRPGMLYAKTLESPYAHARIKSMDTSKAENLPGVRAVVRWDDPMISWGLFHDEMVTDTAHFYRQPIGAVVCADTEAIVDRALELIDVEWEELPFIIDWDEAIKPNAPILRPDKNPDNNIASQTVYNYGDVEEGWRRSTHKIEFRVYANEIVWAGVEPMACTSEWSGNKVDVWPRAQCPIGVQRLIGNAWTDRIYSSLKEPFFPTQISPKLSDINIHTPYIGAIFGGLEWNHVSWIYPLLSVSLSKKLGRPVKTLFEESNFFGLGHVPGTYDIKVGFTDDGRVRAVELTSNQTETSLERMYQFGNCPDMRHTEIYPYINRGVAGCMRSGAPQCMVHNHIYDMIADELEMDPTDVALVNDGIEGHEWSSIEDHKREFGFDLTRDSLKECLEVGKNAIEWADKWHAPGKKILPNGNYHGIGFCWSHEWHPGNGSQNSLALRMRSDGTVNILAQSSDCGFSGPSTWARVVSDELGVKYEDITFIHHDDVGFSAHVGGHSSGLHGNIPALMRAARDLKKQILEAATRDTPHNAWPGGNCIVIPAAFPGKTPEELDIWNSEVFEIANPSNKKTVEQVIKEFGEYVEPANVPFFAAGRGPYFGLDHPTYFMCRQCHFMEVEVDPDTGKVEVTKIVNVNDVGRVINPDGCHGQQYGGSIQGVGRNFIEQIYHDPHSGVELNDNLLGYRVPVMNDCGPVICELVETGLAYGLYGVIGIGEDVGCLTAAMGDMAVFNAIGVHIRDYPITPEKILKALGKI